MKCVATGCEAQATRRCVCSVHRDGKMGNLLVCEAHADWIEEEHARVWTEGSSGAHIEAIWETLAAAVEKRRFVADERQAWDAFALEAMRQILYMAPESLNWSDKMADTPQLFADRVAEVADRMLEKRKARFK